MASCLRTAAHESALLVLKSSLRLCLRPRTGLFTPHRCSHAPRSSLYEHAREGYSDKPDLDMRGVCAETEKVIANVERRKAELRGDDVRKMARCFSMTAAGGSCFSAPLTQHLCVHIAGVCVAGGPSSEERDFQPGRAEGKHQWKSQSSGGR